MQTERKYQTYVDAAPHALLVVDARGRYVDCNPAGLELLGVDATTLKTLSIADFLDESNRKEALHEFTVLLATGKIENDYLIVRPDGRKVWVALRAVKLADDRYLAFCLDVTVRKKAEEALRDCEKRFRALGNGAPVGTFQTGPGGEAVSVNAEWKRMTGLGEAEPVGSEAWKEILHPADRERVSREWKDALDRGRPFAAEFRIQPRGGKVTWVFGGWNHPARSRWRADRATSPRSSRSPSDGSDREPRHAPSGTMPGSRITIREYSTNPCTRFISLLF